MTNAVQQLNSGDLCRVYSRVGWATLKQNDYGICVSRKYMILSPLDSSSYFIGTYMKPSTTESLSLVFTPGFESPNWFQSSVVKPFAGYEQEQENLTYTKKFYQRVDLKNKRCEYYTGNKGYGGLLL